MGKLIKLPPFCQVHKGNMVVSLEVVRDGIEQRNIWLSTEEFSEELFKYISDYFLTDSVSDICLRIRKFKFYDYDKKGV